MKFLKVIFNINENTTHNVVLNFISYINNNPDFENSFHVDSIYTKFIPISNITEAKQYKKHINKYLSHYHKELKKIVTFKVEIYNFEKNIEL